jgi:hypothetical protein
MFHSTRTGQGGAAMTATRVKELQRLEGSRVSLALAGGHRIDDCDLISVGRGRCRSLWIFNNGTDQFVSHSEVIDYWEALP